MTVKQKDFTFINKWNKLVSNIFNHPISNWLKEVFQWHMQYPQYLYCEETGEYVYEIKTHFGYSDITTSDSINFAKDFQKYNPIIKKFIKSVVNKYSGGRVFKYKRVLSLLMKDFNG